MRATPSFSMTSSATQTEAVKERADGPGRLGGRIDLAVGGALLVAGWLLILVINRWYLNPPVVFLGLGWLAVLLCGRFFWRAAMAAATEGVLPDDEGFELSAGRVAELEREKRHLLKAIKEVDFDREMGKMSEADATEITRVYRARAIDILKELEGEGEGEVIKGPRPTLDRVIDREVRARLALAGVAKRKSSSAAPQASAPAAPAVEPEPAAQPESASAPEPEVKPDAESGSESDAEPESGAQNEKREEA